MFIRSLIISIFVVASLVGCSSSSKSEGAPAAVYQIENLNSNYEYYSVNDMMYIGPQPSAENIKEFRSDKDVTVIINLRSKRENKKVKFDPKAVSQKVGIKFYQIPFIKKGSPDKDAMERIEGVIKKHGEVKYLVYDSSGNRAAAWYVTYAASKSEMTLTQAMEVAKNVGLQNKRLRKILTAYLPEQGLTKEAEVAEPTMAKAEDGEGEDMADSASEEGDPGMKSDGEMEDAPMDEDSGGLEDAGDPIEDLDALDGGDEEAPF